MKKYFSYFRNKFILTSTIFFLYALFLDDIDIFSIVRYSRKLSKLDQAKVEMSDKLRRTKYTLKQLHHISALEKYAREEKFFKRDNEDIFVITYE
jgi:cell division protein DivIC